MVTPRVFVYQMRQQTCPFKTERLTHLGVYCINTCVARYNLRISDKTSGWDLNKAARGNDISVWFSYKNQLYTDCDWLVIHLRTGFARAGQPILS